MCHIIKDATTGLFYTGKKLKRWGTRAEAKVYTKREASCTRGGLRNTKALSAASLLIVKVGEEVQHA